MSILRKKSLPIFSFFILNALDLQIQTQKLLFINYLGLSIQLSQELSLKIDFV